MISVHMGRSWGDTHIEDACPCPQEKCGLIAVADPSCGQHGEGTMKTMRQVHRADECDQFIERRDFRAAFWAEHGRLPMKPDYQKAGFQR